MTAPGAFDLDRCLSFSMQLADAARGAILPYFRQRNAVEDKGETVFDPVSEADRAAEQAMRALIERAFPEHGVLGEEYGEKPSRSGFTWVLDPIDGTRAFISGLPLWGVLIALNYEGAPLIGIMDQPFLDERYRGYPGGADCVTKGAVKALKTRACASLSEATLSTTDPYLFTDEESGPFTRLRKSARLTRYGYDCYAYSMIAAGHMDAVAESGLKPFDIQALIPIITGAGGGVCSWTGGDAGQGGRVLAYGDARIRDETLRLLS